MKACFIDGEQVEVSPNEEGFHGSYYTATIIRPSKYKKKTKRNSYLVEYQTLMDENEPSKPLQEFKDVSCIRPKQPKDTIRVFGVNEEVDVFSNEGWWHGLIIKVVGDDKFTVYFACSGDVIEYSKEDLRPHMEWIEGTWVTCLQGGKKGPIEVISNDESCQGVWFPATVVKEISKDSFTVEYRTLKNVDNGEPLREIVNSRCIRPSPPTVSICKPFDVLEIVDAFHNFGWCTGVITRVLAEDRYIIYFKQQDKEIAISQYELRLHMSWTGDEWFQGSRKTPVENPVIQQNRVGISSTFPTVSTEMNIESSPNAAKDNLKKSPSSSRNMTNKMDTPSVTYKASDVKKREHKPSTPESSAENSQPSKKLKKGEATTAPVSEKVCHVEGASIGSFTVVEAQRVLMRPLPEGYEHEGASSTQLRKNPITTICADLLNKRAEEDSELIEKSAIPIGDSLGVAPENQFTAKESIVQGDQSTMSLKLLQPLAVVDCNSQDEQTCSEECDNTNTDGQDKVTLSSLVDADISGQEDEGALPSSSSFIQEESAQPCMKSAEELLPNSVLCEKSDSPSTEETGGAAHEKQLTPNVGITGGDALMESHTLQNSLAAVDCSYSMDKQTILDEYNNTTEDGQHGTTLQCFTDATASSFPSTPRQGDVVAVSQGLPFIKRSALWESVYSMNAFQTIPQQPHFHQLEQENEEIREGIALGYMVSFADLVDKIPTIKVDQQWSTLDNKLEALDCFEELGFTVDPIRSWLLEMRRLKDTYGQLQDGSKAIESKLIDEKQIKGKVEEDIDKLQKALSQMNERLQLIMTEKDAKGSKLAELERTIDELRQNNQALRLAFGNAVAACW